MKNKKPKGKTPSLIGSSNGRPKKVQVERNSECYRCGCNIEPGQDCFGIPKIGSGFSSLKRYCKVCFQNILEQTQKDLEEVKNL
jgi:hypothetical protein